MKDKLTCSECRKKDTSECPMAKAERTVTGEFSGFKTAFEDWEGCSRGEGRRRKQFFRESEAIEIEQGASVV